MRIDAIERSMKRENIAWSTFSASRVDDENFLLLRFFQLTLYATAWNCRNWMNQNRQCFQSSQSYWSSGMDWNRRSYQSDVGRDQRCQMDFPMALKVLTIVLLYSSETVPQHNRDLYRVKFYFLWLFFSRKLNNGWITYLVVPCYFLQPTQNQPSLTWMC